MTGHASPQHTHTRQTSLDSQPGPQNPGTKSVPGLTPGPQTLPALGLGLGADAGYRYGGVEAVLAPIRSSFGRDNIIDPTPRGPIPVYKLHGSLNWEIVGNELRVHSDYRVVFRRNGVAALVPPLPEKMMPAWLAAIWAEAAQALTKLKSPLAAL